MNHVDPGFILVFLFCFVILSLMFFSLFLLCLMSPFSVICLHTFTYIASLWFLSRSYIYIYEKKVHKKRN